ADHAAADPAVTTVPAEQWEVDVDDRAFSTPLNNRETHELSRSARAARSTPANPGPAVAHNAIAETVADAPADDRSPRVIVNGSVLLHDGGVATTSLSVPGDAPSQDVSPAESSAVPSFLPRDWSQWDQEDELSDDRAISKFGQRASESERADDSASSNTTDGSSTRLKPLSWDDDENANVEAVAHDSTQWKMMLGLSCLLAGLAAIGMLRQPRGHVPMAVPVDPQPSRTGTEKSAS
ncbi:MAG: hypothetical protein ACKVT0_03940, partial [Planctomycetaceae bacterium]